MRRRSKIVVAAVLLLGLPFAGEALLALWLAYPAAAPGFLLGGLRRVYLTEDCDAFQADLERVHYDPDVTYLMNPGTFRHAAREFDTGYAANRVGLRDDEASLEAPEVIVLGDSYTMGWGVEQKEAYPQVLERLAELPVLNAGMSSFGTARATILLRRLDTSGVRAVVVQYFMNDYGENVAHVEAGGTLAVSTEEEFLARTRAQAESGYRPFDYLTACVDRSPFFPELEGVTAAERAATFLRVLSSCAEFPPDVPILVFELGAWGEQDDVVVEAAARLLAEDEEFASLRDRIVPVRLADVLGPADFFTLDPHLRPQGHAKVAAVLEGVLREAGLVPGDDSARGR